MSLAVRKISFVDAADGFREREERDGEFEAGVRHAEDSCNFSHLKSEHPSRSQS